VEQYLVPVLKNIIISAQHTNQTNGCGDFLFDGALSKACMIQYEINELSNWKLESIYLETGGSVGLGTFSYKTNAVFQLEAGIQLAPIIRK